MKARTLLKKLTDYGLIVKEVCGNIRLSPRKLINDKVLTFVRTYKNELLCALYDERQERKQALYQGRLEILKVLLRRFLSDPNCRKMVNYKGSPIINGAAIEAYLDTELLNFDYDIEAMIDMYRVYTSAPTLKCKCGYRPPFCSCSNMLTTAHT